MPRDTGVDFIQGDFTEEEILAELLKTIGNKPVDLVISDMAPNLTGMKAVDQPAVVYLAELAVDLAQQVLNKDGIFIAKLFQASGINSESQFILLVGFIVIFPNIIEIFLSLN